MATATKTDIEWIIKDHRTWHSPEQYAGIPIWMIHQARSQDYRLFRHSTCAILYFTSLADAKRHAEEN